MSVWSKLSRLLTVDDTIMDEDFSLIEGAEYVELKGADQCCGLEILDDKMEKVETTAAHYVVTSNPGCLLQMKKGIERAGQQERMQAMHIMDLLADLV
ncbi:cysteine-rich protein [Tumebacillus sp. BK434]|uniref:heterodisulfide reductase-related iron-sulfur binding cluster n=1 Tax=Tumebacillus sp. BK434 TaxID=2512169 RepID=UPI00104E05B6|nr:cysteine-rich protein [Tumebacillus sp. BK434]